jgi:hypothetical protein
MRTLGYFVLGMLAAFGLVWLSAFVYGLLITYLPISRDWWKAHAAMVYGTEILVFVPFAVVIALVSRKLFPRHAVASSVACTLVAFAVLFAPTAVRSYDFLWPSLRINAVFILTFVVGVPLVVFTLQRWRANPA